jgi:hypothetical protein
MLETNDLSVAIEGHNYVALTPSKTYSLSEPYMLCNHIDRTFFLRMHTAFAM